MRTEMASAVLIGGILALFSCSRNNNSGGGPGTGSTGTNQMSDVSFWLTEGNPMVLFQRQNTALLFGTNVNSDQFIDVDSTQTYQTIDGFGFTLTGGSAHVISQMDAISKASLLKELFGNDSTSIGISYLRLSIGSSDLNASVFSYDDIRYERVNTPASADCRHQSLNKNYSHALECAGLDEG